MDMNGCGRRRNRFWPEALKREIVAASFEPGASVSVVARLVGSGGPALDNRVEPHRVLDRGPVTAGHDLALVSANGTWAWRDLDLASDRLAGNLLA